MTHFHRATAILILVLFGAAGAFGQPAQPAATETATETAAASTTTAESTASEATSAEANPSEEMSPWSLREHFLQLVDRHPEEVGRIIALDPTLLLNEPFLARYPDVADFIAQHPEIQRNPHYFVREVNTTVQREGPAEQIIEALSIGFVFTLIASVLAWLIRLIIEQKRWNKLSRTQAEVHTKILDRFGSSEELLAYMKTPAGSKFLESAPIPLHSEPARPQNASTSRAMWSIQIGVIVASLGLGLFLVSLRFAQETAEDLFSLGVVAFFIGAGFIASAAVSIFMTRRLGLLPPPDAARVEHLDDSGVVR
ncbi:MAG TPA: hypothetical protein VFV54_00895 [Thermoanaerobaculia bacterium]|nr:hypothetical protein [Thermoanaerobaculia bacterium]